MINEFISSSFWLELLPKYGLWVMFVSAFLSATLLPGNSEIVFVALILNIISLQISYFSLTSLWLITVAVLGNSLGSLSSYWIGRLFPFPTKYHSQNNVKLVWVIQKIEKFGAWVLLFSWLPFVGDLFCVVAGWLRLNSLMAIVCIVMGKIVRYVFLFFSTISVNYIVN